MWAVNCGKWTYGKNTSHFPGQNRNRHEKSLSVFFPPSLPRVLHLIRHTLISLLFSNFSNAFWQQISHKKCLCPCVKKISSVFRGLWSIIVIFRHLFFFHAVFWFVYAANWNLGRLFSEKWARSPAQHLLQKWLLIDWKASNSLKGQKRHPGVFTK